jgi:chromosome partitioning protein
VHLGNRTGFAASMGDGLTIMETAPGSKGAQEIEQLAAELRRHLGG